MGEYPTNSTFCEFATLTPNKIVRAEMEDTHTCILSLPNHPDTSYFAVFDGHGGTECSEWLSKNLHTYIDELPELEKSFVEQACLKADADFYEQVKGTLKKQDSGSTAVFALVTHNIKEGQNRIIIGHVGDSRAMLIQPDTNTSLQLAFDHKPNQLGEWQRIVDAGWFVFNKRIGGNLAMSRAFGDFGYKGKANLPPVQQAVIPLPDVTTHYVSSDQILLLACDGITDVMDTAAVGEFVLGKMDKNQQWDPAWTVVLMQDKCINLRSHDNMTGMLVSFGDGQGYGDSDPTRVGYLPGPWLGEARTGANIEYCELVYCLAYNRFARKHGYNTAESVAMQKLNEMVGLYTPMDDGLDPKPLLVTAPCVAPAQYQNMLQELDA